MGHSSIREYFQPRAFFRHLSRRRSRGAALRDGRRGASFPRARSQTRPDVSRWQGRLASGDIAGWWFSWNMNFMFPYIGNNHSNWRTHIFQRGWNHQPAIEHGHIAIEIVSFHMKQWWFWIDMLNCQGLRTFLHWWGDSHNTLRHRLSETWLLRGADDWPVTGLHGPAGCSKREKMSAGVILRQFWLHVSKLWTICVRVYIYIYIYIWTIPGYTSYLSLRWCFTLSGGTSLGMWYWVGTDHVPEMDTYPDAACMEYLLTLAL